MEEGSNDRVLEIKTQRGSIAVGYRGFKYNKDKEYLEHKKISWRSSQRGCTGLLETTRTDEPRRITTPFAFSQRSPSSCRICPCNHEVTS